MTYGMKQQKETKAWSADLETEQYAEQLLNDSDVIGELTSDIATANEDALNIAVKSAILGGDVTALNQMFWDAAIARAKTEIEQPSDDYDAAA